MQAITEKVAVVTGAGSGIGRATALALARAGADVAVCDLDAGTAKETADLVATTGRRASPHQIDVSSEAEMRGLVDAVLAEHGHVDIVVNNAGIAIAPTPTLDIPIEHMRRVMEINYWGVVYGSLLFLPHLLSRPEANLVNVASNASLMAYAQMVPYTGSKFAVRGFTEGLRMELSGTPVAVTVVCPGSTKTAMIANSPVMEESRKMAIQKVVDQSWGRPPEYVADRILAAVGRNRPRVLTGPDTMVMDAVVRLVPGAYSRLLAKPVARFMEMTAGKTGK